MSKYKEEILILRDHLQNLNLEIHKTQGIGDCPYCGKPDHFYINKRNFLHDCKKCGESGNLKKLVHHLHIEHLFEDIGVKKRNLDTVAIMDFVNKHNEEKDELEVMSYFTDHYQMISSGDKYYKYLRSRGYRREYILLNRQYFWKQKTNEGRSEYIILPIVMNGRVMGFVARLIWSKEKISEYNNSMERRFAGNDDMIKRFRKKKYKNSTGTKFAQLLYGIDKVRPQHQVIIVEGNFDKLNVDLFIEKYKLQDKFSCVCTFGKKLSRGQINLLKERGVDSVIFLWDEDASKSMHNNGEIYMKSFKKTYVSFIREKDEKGEYLDAGASSPKIIKKAIDNRISYSSFMFNKVDLFGKWENIKS